MRKFILTCVMILSLICYAQEESKISLNFSTNLGECFNIISQISGYTFYIDENVSKDRTVNFKVDNSTIDEILDILLKLNGLKMERALDKGYYVFPSEKERSYYYTEIKSFMLENADPREITNIIMSNFQNAKIYTFLETNTLTITASKRDLEEIQKIITELDNEKYYHRKTYRLSYIKAEEAGEEINKSKKNVKVNINKGQNSITIIANKNMFEDIDRIIEDIDIKLSQTIIEILLLDVNDSFTRDINIDWNTEYSKKELSSIKIGTIIRPDSINIKEVSASAEILARPVLRVTNNETAKINIGERVPIVISKPTGVASGTTGTDKVSTVPSVEYKDVGIQMEVVPTIHKTKDITIKLTLEVSSLGEFSTKTEYGDYPSFVTKNISTIVRLKNGETAVFGGLINNEERKFRNKIPILGDIPVIGWIFSSQYQKSPKKSEIIMLVTPKIVNLGNEEMDSETNLEIEKSKSYLNIINKYKGEVK